MVFLRNYLNNCYIKKNISSHITVRSGYAIPRPIIVLIAVSYNLLISNYVSYVSSKKHDLREEIANSSELDVTAITTTDSLDNKIYNAMIDSLESEKKSVSLSDGPF